MLILWLVNAVKNILWLVNGWSMKKFQIWCPTLYKTTLISNNKALKTCSSGTGIRWYNNNSNNSSNNRSKQLQVTVFGYVEDIFVKIKSKGSTPHLPCPNLINVLSKNYFLNVETDWNIKKIYKIPDMWHSKTRQNWSWFRFYSDWFVLFL